MKEIRDIIHAYDAALAAGKKSALATVVHVEGSSYRRPGARMLVRDDGILTGAISGGCLEGDALRKALLAMQENKNKLVVYDTTDADDAKFGVQLGCNGIVYILFEPLDETLPNNPLHLLKMAYSKRRNAVLVTLFSLQKKNFQPGTIFFITSDKCIRNEAVVINESINQAIRIDMAITLGNQISIIKNYTSGEEDISACIQALHPPVSLVIFGAGNDAIPLVSMG
ncbi:MAG: XdhC family protein, partial [Flavitalea sp.]